MFIQPWMARVLLKAPVEMVEDVFVFEKNEYSYQRDARFENISPSHRALKYLPVLFRERYPLQSTDIVLDLGAGGCNLSSFLQKRYDANVCALDNCLDVLIAGKAFMDYFNVDKAKFSRVCMGDECSVRRRIH